MKANTHEVLPTWLQRTLTWSLGLIVVSMPLHGFISTWGGTAVGPLWLWKSWKEILLAVLMIPTVVWLSSRPKRWNILAKDKLFWLIVGFVGLLGILNLQYFSANGRDAAMAGMAMDTRYLLIFGLSYILFRFGKFSWPSVRRYVAFFLIIAGILLAVLGLIQVKLLPADFLSQFGYNKDTTIAPFTLIDENPGALRAFATLRGPNDFGAFLILPLILSLLFARKNKWFLAGSAVIVTGLITSGSRSAWIGAVISLAALAFLLFGSQVLKSRKAIGVIGASAVAVVILGIAAISVPSLRLAVFHSSPGDSSLTEGSTDKHWQATATGLQHVADRPLGCGAGCAGPASYYSSHPSISENYYVQIAEETGVIGLALWALIFAVVMHRLWQRRNDWLARAMVASGIGLAAIGFWLHVWADDPLSLTWWAIAGIILGYYASASHKKPVS